MSDSSSAAQSQEPTTNSSSANGNGDSNSQIDSKEETTNEKQDSTKTTEEGKINWSEKIEFEDIIVSGWLYKDTEGKEQGPFSTMEMRQWWLMGYFTPDLLVRRVNEDDFVEISTREEVTQGKPPGQAPPPYPYGMPSTYAYTTPHYPAYSSYYQSYAQPTMSTDSKDDASAAASASSASAEEDVPEEAFKQRAVFNIRTGKFVGTDYEDHWAKKGLPSDKAGRQLAMYMDIDAYQEMMREAKRQKQAEGQKRPKITKKMIEEFKRRREERKKRKLLM